MKLLASRIAFEVTTNGHCAIYEEELIRIWPISDEGRERKIRQFAHENGLCLRFYKPGLCAIFDKDSANLECAADQKTQCDSHEISGYGSPPPPIAP